MNFTRTLIIVLLSVGAAACVTGRATEARREPLVVPPPPPRVIVPAPEPEEPAPPGVTEPEPVPPLPRASRPAPQRTEPKQTEPPLQPEAGAVPPANAPTPNSSAPNVPSELRTPETPDDARATKQVRDTLSRAAGTLGRIDYRNLSQPARLQYDMAKHFMEQADEALKAKNYTAAQLMAEKAETIAKELSGR